MKRTQQEGNILFLILIAVALFAALSYAVTGSSRTSANSISKDKAKILAAEIIQYAAQIEQGISRMRIINNVPEYGFDVSASGYSNSAPNATCSSNNCKLFNVNGGNIPPKILPKEAWDLSNSNMVNNWQGKIYFVTILVLDVGSIAPEFAMVYPGMNGEVCSEINKKLNVANDSDGSPPNDHRDTNSNYSSTLTSFPSLAGFGIGNQDSRLSGKRSFCVTQNDGAHYFYHVLIPR